MAEKKIGIYISVDYGIGDAIDCEKLAEELKNAENVVHVEIAEKLCTPAGVEIIKKDISEKELNAVLIGASSPRFHTDVFTFDESIVYDRVSLRELVAWTHTHKDEHTQMLALDYMKMGVAKLNSIEPPEPMALDINDSVLVVGGGYTGMNAALNAAKAGYNVVICEKEKELGGYYRKLYKVTPITEPYMDPEPNTCDALIAEVMSLPKIKVLTNCKIDKTDGQPGMFDVSATIGEDKMDFQVGAIIQATGFKPIEKSTIKYYDVSENVITNLDMEELAKSDNLKRPSDGNDIKNVVFVQCANRDKCDDLYCSSVCCMTSLKQAMYVREKFPDANIYIVYKNMRTPAQYELFYKRVQNLDNMFLTKGAVADISANGEPTVNVDIDDTLIGEKIQIEADLVVLATGMKPSTFMKNHSKSPDLAPDVILEEIKESEENPQDDESSKGGSDFQTPQSNILNLTYRQGPELPVLKYGFPESHYICFPYETRRTGIYAAGTVRSPMDLLSCKSDAEGAAMKAIQVIENNRRGTAVHPRSGDKSFPDFFLQRCTQCKRCTEECPFGTLDEDVKGTPKPNPNRCRRCGICMGACPERIISFKNYSVRMISNMIKSIYIPTEEEDGEATPRILAFMCENDAYPSLDIAARKGYQFSPHIRVIPIRCLGSMSISWIADALSAGFDGVILFGCKYGDDYQCHFIRGSLLANKRMENVQEKLKQLVLEPERVELHMLSIDEYDKVPNILNTFAQTIEDLEPNPYKEM